MFGRKAAPGGRQGERPLDLVAGAHAAAAGDAQLVLDDQVRVAAVVVRSRLHSPASAARRRRSSAATWPSSVCSPGGACGSSDSTSSTVARGDAPRGLVLRVDHHAVAAGRRARGDRPGLPRPSTPTMQTRQAPNGSMRSSKQSVGTYRPARRAASRTVAPGSTSTSTPSTVTFTSQAPGSSSGSAGGACTDRPGRRAPPAARRHAELARASGRSGCGSAPACRRRGRRATRAPASRAAPRASRGPPAPRASTISCPRCNPIRQGKHLPQLSCAPNSSRCRASARMSVRSSKARIPPWPTMQPSAASSSKSKGVSSCPAGRIPPSGPPIWSALIACPSRSPPPSSSQISPIGVPKRHLVDARAREALVEADELRAGRRAGAERACRPRRPRAR